MPVHYDSAAIYPLNAESQLQERNRVRALARLPVIDQPVRTFSYDTSSLGNELDFWASSPPLPAPSVRDVLNRGLDRDSIVNQLSRMMSAYSNYQPISFGTSYLNHTKPESQRLSNPKIKVVKERSAVPNIKDKIHYYDEMTKSIDEKLFFFDKIYPGLIVDFGCGDGSMIKEMKNKDRAKTYIGYDISKDALDKALVNIHANEPQSANSSDWWTTPRLNVQLTSDWKIVDDHINQFKSFGIDSALVLSSVIHEVLSYCSPEEIKNFWKRVYKSNFTYIVIRDMIPSRNIDRPASKDIVDLIRERYASDLIGHANLREFEEHWGSIDNEKNLVHFLLKYRFTENWTREVKENYIPTFFENFMASIPLNYDPIHVERYTHKFTQKKIKEDFNVTLDVETHVNLILKREQIHGDAINP